VVSQGQSEESTGEGERQAELRRDAAESVDEILQFYDGSNRRR